MPVRERPAFRIHDLVAKHSEAQSEPFGLASGRHDISNRVNVRGGCPFADSNACCPPASLTAAVGILAMTALLNHCCPVCGHPVGAKRWFWRAWIWARWPCESCGMPLRFDFRRRLLFALFIGLSFMAASGIAAACILLHVSPWIWAGPLLAALIFGLIFLVRSW